MHRTQCYMGVAFRSKVNREGGIRGRHFSIKRIECSLIFRRG